MGNLALRFLASVLLLLILLSVRTASQHEIDRLALDQAPVPRPHEVPEREEADRYGDHFDWQQRTPVQFLSQLTRSGRVSMVHGIHAGWLQPSDLPELLALVDSTLPCAHAVSTYSSSIPKERSTVGVQAVFLIWGLREGRYPPATHAAPLEQVPWLKQDVVQWAQDQVRGEVSPDVPAAP